MENTEEFALGLDIGTTKVCAVLGRVITKNNRRRLEIVAFGESGYSEAKSVEKGVVKNVNAVAKAVKNAMDEITPAIQGYYQNQSVPQLAVNLNVTGQHISRTNKPEILVRRAATDEVVNDADVEDLRIKLYQISVAAGCEIIHVLPIDFSLDDECGIINPIGRMGARLEGNFQIITAQTRALREIQASINLSNSNLVKGSVVLSPLASALSVLEEEEMKSGVVLIDIGGGTTDVVVYENDIMRHVAVLSLAGAHITHDIATAFGLNEKQAELLKIKFGNACPWEWPEDTFVQIKSASPQRPPKEVMLKNVAVVIQARLREIAAQVNEELERSGYKHKLIDGIVITGGSAVIPGIENVFKEVIGVEYVRIGTPQWLEVGKNAEIANKTSYATALGLVWSGFKMLDKRICKTDAEMMDILKHKATKIRPVTPDTEAKKPTILKRITSFFNDDLNDSDSRYGS